MCARVICRVIARNDNKRREIRARLEQHMSAEWWGSVSFAYEEKRICINL
jgi:hypothetical protein